MVTRYGGTGIALGLVVPIKLKGQVVQKCVGKDLNIRKLRPKEVECRPRRGLIDRADS